MLRFERPDRYYTFTLARDLLGDVVLIRAWGGKHNRLGGMAIERPACITDRLRELRKERRAHGYVRVSPFAQLLRRGAA